jgi:uncharacterized C2H2 Zn-finger protein
MPEFKCPRCDKCLASKQKLTQHLNKKIPCVADNVKTKYKCKRCLKHLSSKRRLIEHLNKQQQCKIYRTEPIIKNDIEDKIDFERKKSEMMDAMKKELFKEKLKLYKRIDNSEVLIRLTKKLTEKYKYNLKHLKERITLPDKMPSIIPIKNKDMGTVDEMIEKYKNLKNCIAIAEKDITNLSDMREKALNIRKEILKNMKLSEFRMLLTKNHKSDTNNRKYIK